MVVLAAVLCLTLVAAGIRLALLVAPDGRLHKDEAKLALAADGVLQSGLPVLPSGRLYTRGLANSYLIAPSFAFLGRHDFAARLHSALAGALLVPALFLLGRALGGPAAGLAAAGFAVVAEPLVFWSGQAWPPSLFLLLFTLAVLCFWRGFLERRGPYQLAGAVLTLLALLTYEFAMLLPAAVAIYLGSRVARREWDWYCGRPTLLALGLLAASPALFVGLALALRAGTLAGPASEMSVYFSPSLAADGLAFYLHDLLANYALLVAAALLGLPLLARTAPRPACFMAILLALAVLVPCVMIQNKLETRYGLPILLLFATLGAAGAVHLGRLVGSRLVRGRALRAALPLLALLGTFGPGMAGDLALVAAQLRQRPGEPTWLQALHREGLRPGDVVISQGPERARFYLGRVDFHVPRAGSTFLKHGEDGAEERYSYRAPDAIRSIYSDSVLLHQHGDFERLVEQPHRGRNVWIVGEEEQLRLMAGEMDPGLWPSLLRSASRRVEPPDGWILLKLALPRRRPA